MSHILIIDDESAICWSLQRLLQTEGHSVEIASSAEDGLKLARKTPPDAIMLDVRLPGMNGLDAIEKFQAIVDQVPIVLMTAFGDLQTAVDAYEKQVAEYLTKPFDLERAAEVIRSALATQATESLSLDPAADQLSLHDHTLVGRSPAMQEVFKRIALAAQGDIPVLITGESGTGKELAAAAIHAFGPRRKHPYVPVALPSLNASLIESELFGHAKGSFTGAIEKRDGLFAIAAQGTILLDEIGDLPAAQQVKLLRILEQKTYTPVGDIRPRQCDVRILAATHQDLASKIGRGEFREDLYFRLAVFEIRMPALRERLDDLPLLCQHLLHRIQYPNSSDCIDSSAMEALMARTWRGNVRELRNTLEHAALMARGSTITVHHLPAEQSLPSSNSAPEVSLTDLVRHWVSLQLRDSTEHEVGLFDRFLAEVEPPLLRDVLEATKGNRAAAANLLGFHRATLREKLRKYGINDSE